MQLVSSCVKTEAYWLLRIFALPWASEISTPFCFSGATPEASFFKDFFKDFIVSQLKKWDKL
jgi:hypothetical protein